MIPHAVARFCGFSLVWLHWDTATKKTPATQLRVRCSFHEKQGISLVLSSVPALLRSCPLPVVERETNGERWQCGRRTGGEVAKREQIVWGTGKGIYRYMWNW